MNKTLIGLIAVVMIGAGVYYFGSGSSRTMSDNAIYCSTDGTLSETQSIQRHRSYCIKSNIASLNIQPNVPVSLSFSIVDDEGNTVKDFALVHDMLLHLIVVRKDLNSFQHLHPEIEASTGQFTLSDLTFPSSGPYRIFADFTPSNAQMGADGMPLGVTISEDVTVAGTYTAQAIGATERTKTFDGYEVTLTTSPESASTGMTMMSYTIKKDGKPITNLESYLAALGHSVVLKENTLDYIHAHAVQEPTARQTGTIDFHVEFPLGGNYKTFTQFKHEGRVHTVEFVVPVNETETSTIPEMDHGEHVPTSNDDAESGSVIHHFE